VLTLISFPFSKQDYPLWRAPWDLTVDGKTVENHRTEWIKKSVGMPSDTVLTVDGKMVENGRTEWILESVGMPSDTVRRIKDRNYRSTHNELIALFCPFLPLKDSTIATVYWSGWRPGRESVFHYWEGRFGLLRALEKMEKKPGSPQNIMYKHMIHFRDKYDGEFFCRWGQTVLEGRGEGDPVKRRRDQLEFLDYARAAFEETTTYFEKRGYHNEMERERGTGRTRYMHLVMAHISMSVYAIEHALAEVAKEREDPKLDRSQDGMEKRYDLPRSKYIWFVEQLYRIAIHYARDVRHGKHSVVSYMRERGETLSDDEIGDACEYSWA